MIIYAGATILGRITIGKGSVIGGNVWLTHSVPAGSQILQSPSESHHQKKRLNTLLIFKYEVLY